MCEGWIGRCVEVWRWRWRCGKIRVARKDSWGARGINKLCNGAQLRCCWKGALGAPPTCQLADVAMSNTDQLVLGWAFSQGDWLRGM
jgi:hypothetical protein